jgi:GINS complex subunit 2
VPRATPRPRTQGNYGPFRPNMPVEVPIWLALQLHKRSKCRILPPAFLDPARLQGERGAGSEQ